VKAESGNDVAQLTDAEIHAVAGGIASGIAAIFQANPQFWSTGFVQGYLEAFAKLREVPQVRSSKSK
jgi:hypothetical protein